jgi:phage-related protein
VALAVLNILGWLINTLSGPIADVIKWVNKAFDAVFGYIDSWVHALENELVQGWRAVQNFASSVESYAIGVYNYAKGIYDFVMNAFHSWVLSLWNDLKGYAEGVYNMLISWIDWLKKSLDNLWNQVVQWVISNIGSPLTSDILKAWNWITHEGSFIWQLLSDPVKLADYIGKYLWSAWSGLLITYSKPIARWLMHNMLAMTHEFATIIEDIIAGLL